MTSTSSLRCFISVGELGSTWTLSSSTQSCSGCQSDCSDMKTCYYFVWSGSLDCVADGNSCPRSVKWTLFLH